jgi:hypothetical protein
MPEILSFTHNDPHDICGIMKPIDIGLIQARRQKIVSEVNAEKSRFAQLADEHASRITALENEANELAIAERVFVKLTKGDTSAESQAEDQTSESTGKPEGTPSVPDMILEALNHAHGFGRTRLRPAEMLSYIRGKWWPSAEGNAVSSIAWRMWQRGQLAKYQDGTYSVPPPAAVAEATQKAENAAA